MYNKRMNENELSVLVNNEIEWRKQLWKKMEKVEDKQGEIDKRVIRLELKNAFFGSLFGFIAGIIGAYFKNKL